MTDPDHLIIVEDEPITRSQLRAHFEAAGFIVEEREDGVGLLERVLASDSNIVLLDIRLPGKDGLTLAREIRAASDVGIILVTSQRDQIDKLIGLESGADDYVTKPFDPRELVSRTRNLQRRVRAQRRQRTHAHLRRFAGFTLDLNRRELTAPDGEQQHLTAGEFQLLLTFIDHAGEVMSRDLIMARIRNREWYPDDRYIDVLVGHLRRKLGETASNATLVTTIHGTGYLFSPEVI
ncbi:MAG: response regulator [Gammaproteobacteria bacterium]|nr:MAG: response regulator [Gammaproteobacteria bacterium]